MAEKSSAKEIFEKLSYKKKNVFEAASSTEIKEIFDYSVGYMQYLDGAKTEREATDLTREMAEKNGFIEYKFGDKLAVGQKRYLNNNGKSIILFTVGSNDIEAGRINM